MRNNVIGALVLAGIVALGLVGISASASAATSHTAPHSAVDARYCSALHAWNSAGIPSNAQTAAMGRAALAATGEYRRTGTALYTAVRVAHSAASEARAALKVCAMDAPAKRAVRSTRCAWTDRHAPVLCVQRQPREVCREALGKRVSVCWGFVGSDTQVIFNWRGMVTTS